MFHDGQEFDVRKAHLDDVVGQFGRQLPVVEDAAGIFRHAHPGT